MTETLCFLQIKADIEGNFCIFWQCADLNQYPIKMKWLKCNNRLQSYRQILLHCWHFNIGTLGEVSPPNDDICLMFLNLLLWWDVEKLDYHLASPIIFRKCVHTSVYANRYRLCVQGSQAEIKINKRTNKKTEIGRGKREKCSELTLLVPFHQVRWGTGRPPAARQRSTKSFPLV